MAVLDKLNSDCYSTEISSISFSSFQCTSLKTQLFHCMYIIRNHYFVSSYRIRLSSNILQIN